MSLHCYVAANGCSVGTCVCECGVCFGFGRSREGRSLDVEGCSCQYCVRIREEKKAVVAHSTMVRCEHATLGCPLEGCYCGACTLARGGDEAYITPPRTIERPSDPVNHPKHYNDHPSGVECVVIAEGFNFNVGNAIKYLWRAGLKSKDPVEDLRKAAWYVNREIERLTREKKT